MNSYDEECIQFFLENQLQLFPEAVAETPEEAEEFLDDCMAVVCDTRKEALAYLEEVFALPSGRYLIVEA